MPWKKRVPFVPALKYIGALLVSVRYAGSSVIFQHGDSSGQGGNFSGKGVGTSSSDWMKTFTSDNF